jgi:hypothetical protein
MPIVMKSAVLAEVYAKTKAKIEAREIPTLFIEGGHYLYRSINPKLPHSYLPKPASGAHVSKAAANKLLIASDRALRNRFSGLSGIAAIPPAWAIYCVLQQQALVNESAHYGIKVRQWTLTGSCVLRICVMGRIMAADLSPHNPAAKRFLRELGKNIWERMNDSDDCSVARGIGLAIAHSGYLQALSVQTVRESERSDEERGDNLVLYAPAGQPVPSVYIDQVSYYGKVAQPEIFPVMFP